MNTIFKHLKSGNHYILIGVGRSVDHPHKLVAVYKQLYDSKLFGTSVQLPYGSIWTRDLNDFEKKFKLIKKNLY